MNKLTQGKKDKPSPHRVTINIHKATGPVIGTKVVEGNEINNHPIPSAAKLDSRALDDYRRHISQLFREVTDASLRFLPGGEVDSKGCQPPRLAEVYIALDTKPDPRTGPENGRDIKGGRLRPDQSESKPVPSLKRLADHSRLVLLGMPGSGKSTFLKHLSLCLAQHNLEPKAGWLQQLKATYRKDDKAVKFSWPKALADLVPVFVELRKFAEELAEAPPPNLNQPDCARLWQFVENQLRLANLSDTAPALVAAIKAGRAIVFLDGLDEVPSDDLKRFISSTVAAFAKPPFERSRFVVTCRTVSYQDEAWRLPGFHVSELAKLDDQKIQRFIEKFYTELAKRRRDIASRRAASLSQAITQRDELHEMAGNPYLLSLMAQLHLRTELPAQRAALFENFVDELLFAWEADKRRDAQGPSARGLSELLHQAESSRVSFRAVLSKLAFDAHRAGLNRNPGDDRGTSIYISEQQLADALAELPPMTRWSAKKREEWAMDVIHLIEHRAGLIVSQGGHQFSMAFKLQEFMAAVHVCNADFFELETAAELIADDSGYWEEVVRLAAGYQAHEKKSPAAARSLALTLCRLPASSDATAVRRAALASQILYEIGLNNVQRTDQGKDCLTAVRERLDQLASKPNLQIRPRAEATSARGWLEALPEGVGLRDVLPDLVFEEELPAGTIKLAGNNQLVKIKHPYRFGRYPVTVAQYEPFKAVGYDEKNTEAPKWWGEEGWRWKVNNKIAGPEDYDPVFQTPNHPRVGVSWYEAMAFCRWLTEQLQTKERLAKDQNINLPTEAQWEWAARWNRKTRKADDRSYPWGAKDDKDLAQRCNMWETGIGRTSAVGLFPNGKADCGAMDLSGNVWKWCKNWYDGKAKKDRVLRGGSWFNVDPEYLSCSFRYRVTPDFRYYYSGFRYVLLGDWAPE
jgi:formylglycine-generating enzyme required for sulfatase activity